MNKVQEGSYSLQTVGKGPNKITIFSKPLEIELDDTTAEGIQTKSQVARYVSISPQFGIGSIDFVKAMLIEGEWKSSATLNTKSAFDHQIMEYGGDQQNSYPKTGAYVSDSSFAEFSLYVGGSGYFIKPDLKLEALQEALLLNKTEKDKIEPNEEKLVNRISAVDEALKLI